MALFELKSATLSNGNRCNTKNYVVYRNINHKVLSLRYVRLLDKDSFTNIDAIAANAFFLFRSDA